MSDSSNVNFVIDGNLGGSKPCRHWDLGYSILTVMESLSSDFFIFNGDQICADQDYLEKPSDFVLRHFPGWKNIKVDFPSATNRSVNWTDQINYI